MKHEFSLEYEIDETDMHGRIAEGERDFVIDSEDYERWKRQMNTDYEDLSEKEKDRNIAKEFKKYLYENGYVIIRREDEI